MSGKQILIGIFIFAFIAPFAAGQEKGADTLQLNPLYVCCNNGATGFWCGESTGIKLPESNCQDVTHTVRKCVDLTGDLQGEYVCGNTFVGARYCSEVRNSSYPRYYAWTPIQVNPASLTFTAQYGGSNPPAQPFLILNGVSDIDYTLHWSASEGANWLSLSPTSGTVSGTNGVWVTANVNAAGLLPGSYSATITVSATEVSSRQNASVSVTLNVTGMAVSISGPEWLNPGQMGTWTANPTGGTPPYHYAWYKAYPCLGGAAASNKGISPNVAPCDTWIQFGGDNQSVSTYDYQDFKLKVRVTDANNQSAEDEIYVSVGSSRKVLAQDQFMGSQSVLVEEPRQLLSSQLQNYPNPFNPTTTIRYQLPVASHVTVSIYDLWGQWITTIVDGDMLAGEHTAIWDGRNASGDELSSGVHLCRTMASSFSQAIKIILVR